MVKTITEMRKEMSSSQVLGLICAILLPPLGAIVAKASVGHIILNILLTIFGFWICGVLHAAYLVMSNDELKD